MRAELKRLQSELGITFIHVTHSQEEAMALSDLVVVMNAGRIEQAGGPREVFNRPATVFVARFIGGHNIIDLDGRRIAVRADRIRITPRQADPEARPARISAIEYQGSFVQVSLKAAAQDLTAVMADDRFEAQVFHVGAGVWIDWDRVDAHELQASR
jgi:putative spermidine/putrescine transport system ATP-binding protein